MTNRPGDQRFYRLLDEIANLHARKSADYSPGENALRNFKRTEAFGLRPYLGMLARLGDKWSRIETFGKSGQLQNESARDSHIDSAVYHLIAVLLLEDEQLPTADNTPTAFLSAFTLGESLGGCMGDPDPDPVPLTVKGSDEPAVYLPPNFGPGSEAANTGGPAGRVYIGEDGDEDRACIIGHV